jgi:predicted MFS family arabinose efflux permease
MIADHSSRHTEGAASIAVTAAIIAVTWLFYNIQPAIVAAAQDSLGLNEQELGFLVAGYNLGLAISTLLAVLWIRAVNWRFWSGVSLFVAAAGLVLLVPIERYLVLLLLLVCIGFANGATLSICVSFFGGTAAPERNFAIGLAAQTILSSLLLYLLPTHIAPRWGLTGCLITLAIITTMALSLTPLFPAHGRAESYVERVSSSRKFSCRDYLISFSALTGMLLYTIGQSAIWPFLELIGTGKGISRESVAVIMSTAVLLSITGCILAAVIGSRFGRVVPIICAAVMAMSAIILWNLYDSKVAFFLGVFFHIAAWNFSIPFQCALVAESDPRGSLAPLMGFMQVAGSVIGPSASGTMLANHGELRVFLFAGGFIVLSTLSFIVAKAKLKRR